MPKEIELIRAGYSCRSVEITKYRAHYVAQNLLKGVKEYLVRKTVHGYEVWVKKEEGGK